MKKIWNFFKNFVIMAYILLIIFVTICLLSYNDYKVTEFGKYTLLPVIDSYLEPEYKVGDLLIVEKNSLKDVKVGDIIFYYRTSRGITTVNYAPVTELEVVTNTETTFTVVGDVRFSSSYFMGKADTAKTIPQLGKVLGLLQSKWGFLFLGVFPSLLAFLYTLYSVIAEVQNDKVVTEEPVKKKKKKKKKPTSESSSEKIDPEQPKKKKKPAEELDTEEIPKKKKKKKVEVSEVEDAEDKKVEEKVETESKVETKKEDVEINKEDKKEEKVVKVETKTEEKKETPKQQPKQLTEEQKKALIEAKMKTMTEEEKKALIEAKLKSMTPEQKKALIEAKKKKMMEDNAKK